MFGKKKMPVVNPYDKKMQELLSDLSEIAWDMGKKAIEVYIKAQAVSLYSESTPDWKKACDDRESARYSLLCFIGNYDGKRADIMRYREAHKKDFTQGWSKPLDSHEMIEMKLRCFLEKK